MGLKVQVKAMDLFGKIINGNVNTISYIDFAPQKPNWSEEEQKQPFPRSTPEKQGIHSEYIQNFLQELENNKSINPHSIMIVRNGYVIAEGTYQPFDGNVWQITHSLCKSLVGIAVGIAEDKGYLRLDETVASIFNKNYFPLIGKKKKEITIEHLLKMSSGITFGEVGAVIEDDWVSRFLKSSINFEPGTKFAYNSMNTYMLSAIIKKKTGKGLLAFLKEYLLKPMGIEKIYWEKCPKGIEKGGWGLYINIEDRTKIGQLMLNKGKWNGQQLISESWIERMTRKQIDTPKELNEDGYGYQVWIGKRKGSFQFNGLLGQNTIVFPDINMIISVTSGNNELFIASDLKKIIEKYFCTDTFCPGGELPENKVKASRLSYYLNHMYVDKTFVSGQPSFNKHSGWQRKKKKHYYGKSAYGMRMIDIPEGIRGICGKEYIAEETNASIVPAFIEVMQNSFSKGVDRFSFSIEKGIFMLNLIEGEKEFHLPIGFQKPQHTIIDFNGEQFLTNVWGKWTVNEDEIPVLKIMFCYEEYTNLRFMKFFFYDGYVVVKMSEMPDLRQVLDEAIPILNFSLSESKLEMVKNMGITQYKMKNLTAPEFRAEIKNDRGI